ncbi:hypothetical protein HY632_03205 [Candidatus Uhrbacteria bacterium]|nr:hypothetical protein [Candidatus Uhrbacteria bacterium]
MHDDFRVDASHEQIPFLPLARVLVALPLPHRNAILLAADARPVDAHHASRSSFGGKSYRSQHPMTSARGATTASAAASIAVALALVLMTAYGLTLLERRVMDASSPLQALFAIRAAHAATAPARAPLLLQSARGPLTMIAGSEVDFTFGYKNATSRAWVLGKPSTVLLRRTDLAKPSALMASTWIDSLTAAAQTDASVTPGALTFLTARFRAPDAPGVYADTFSLQTLDGTILGESATTITLTVLAAPEALPPSGPGSVWGPPALIPADPTPANAAPTFPALMIAADRRYTTEPIMRIGITYSEPTDARWNPHRIRSASPMRVTADGTEVLQLPANTVASIDYRPRDKTYHLRVGDTWHTTSTPVRFAPTNENATVFLTSYTDPLHWEGNTADNEVRGLIEIRYVPETDRFWAINELPIEDYLRGLTETSDGAPEEFHKAQVIAGRTFALYHLDLGGKYKVGQFILRGDARDQVYRGENAARRRPNLVRAVEATRGVIATYNGNIAITPYYAQSDGRTRGWHEVWGGKPKAWLTSVADPTCEGKRLIGHGVGMSQRCAMTLASQGWPFHAILQHYYAGTELRKVYE